MTRRPVPWRVAGPFGALLLAVAGFLTVRGLALYGDGSFYLVNIADAETVYGRTARLFVIAVRQAPTLVAVRAGVTDLHLLTVVLGVGQLVFPALVWLAALVLARRSAAAFAVVALAAGICTGTKALFNVGESSFAVPVALLVSVLLWQPAPWRLREGVLVIAASVVLVESHEVILFACGLNAVWAILRARRADARAERSAAFAVASLAVLTIVLAVAELVEKRDNPPARGLADAVLALRPLELYTMLVTAAALLVLIGGAPGPRARLVLVSVGSPAALASLFGLFATDGDAYSARGGAALVGLIVASALLVAWLEPGGERFRLVDDRLAATGALWCVVTVAALPLLALAARGERWADSLALFRAGVVARAGVVPVTDVLPEGRRQVLFDWTAMPLSLAVRDRPGAAILVDPAPTFVPFPPAEAHQHLRSQFVWNDW